MAGTIREALEAAVEEHTSEEEKSHEPAGATPKVAENTDTGKPEEAAAVAEEGSAAPIPDKPEEGKPAKTVRAPASWRPSIREAFGKLPPEIQEEVNRRESEINSGLREASESRRVHREMQEIVAPYMAQITAEGGTPMGAFKSLLNTAHILRNGAPQQKAILAAQMVMQHGIPIEMLDSALAQLTNGQVPRNDPTIQAIDQRLAPVMEFMQRMNSNTQQYQQRQDQSIEQELASFIADPKNEFYSDVADDMADILDLGARRGKQITLQEAYGRATMLHPEISEVISKRKLAEQVGLKSAAAKRAKIAGASVGGGAPPQNEVKPIDQKNRRRAALEAAFNEVEDQNSM